MGTAPELQGPQWGFLVAGSSPEAVSELLVSGPYQLLRSTPGPGRFTLSWTPSQREAGQSHAVCFVVQAVSQSVPEGRSQRGRHDDITC
ncbi:hypothetical protein EYF80_067541 [Liparis tanakae]|uniref:Uncharacterized protein n=1 Tax=Liparis tanakae TaxID=230148 RepID=A0A4Z2E0Q4_9TELE|nr:hypothetical protein EYF80_067541 [Liparis tanakae]